MSATPDETPSCVVVGLGSQYRGDDGVGPLIVRELARHLDTRDCRVRVVEQAEPSALLDLWEDVDFALIVDAVRTRGSPGSLTILEAGTSGEALPASVWQRTGRGGTHALGLAACIELARVLERLPRRLLVVGVEGARFERGVDLTDPVRAGIGPAVEAILKLLPAGSRRG